MKVGIAKRMKPILNGKYLAFFPVVVLLLVTAVATARCPVCGGTGIINNTPGAEKVTILGFEDDEFPFQKDVCGVYIVYKHGITMELLNDGDAGVQVWIKMTLLDTNKEKGSDIVDTQYVKILVPAATVVKNAFNVYFGSGIDVPGRTIVQAEVVVGGAPDAACKGRGQVSLNTWPFTAILKSSFAEAVRQENPYKPPVVIDWKDYIEDADH